MFNVYDKKTSESVKVYDVQRDKNGYPQFLIRKDDQWIYRSAKHYTNDKYCNCKHEWKDSGYRQPAIYDIPAKTIYRCTKCDEMKIG